jgi:hypothetical protein
MNPIAAPAEPRVSARRPRSHDTPRLGERIGVAGFPH